jgi:hypothetical protein
LIMSTRLHTFTFININLGGLVIQQNKLLPL